MEGSLAVSRQWCALAELSQPQMPPVSQDAVCREVKGTVIPLIPRVSFVGHAFIASLGYLKSTTPPCSRVPPHLASATYFCRHCEDNGNLQVPTSSVTRFPSF